MTTQNISILSICLTLVILLPTTISYAKMFESNGYEVELNWKVKKKKLKMYGAIRKGKKCARLKIYAHLYNDRYKKRETATLKTVIKTKHYPSSRSTFQGEDRIYSNRFKNGWIVDSLSVSCTNVNPAD